MQRILRYKRPVVIIRSSGIISLSSSSNETTEAKHVAEPITTDRVFSLPSSRVIHNRIKSDWYYTKNHYFVLQLCHQYMLYHYKQRPKKNILNFNPNLTLRYISIAVIFISTLDIVFPDLLFS